MTTLVKTRRMVTCPMFGVPKEISQIVLPTYENVMKHYLLVKNQMKPTAATKDPSVTDISEKVRQVVEGLWFKASLPFISHTRVLAMIRSYHDKYRKLMRNIKRNKNDSKVNSFKNAKHQLFDISACKCAFEECNCDKTHKVPSAEQDFL